MIVELLEQALKLAKHKRMEHREDEEKDREYGILVSELEKLIAYAKGYEL